MKFFIVAALFAVASANPIGHYGYGHVAVAHHEPTIIQSHAQTYYAPITSTKYGSQINHLVAVPAPIIQGVPQPYAVPVPEPYAVPRPVPVAVPRAVPVEVPRAVPVPLVAHAAPLVTKSVVHSGSHLAHGGYGDGGLAYGGGYGHGDASHLGYGHGAGLALGHGAGHLGGYGYGAY